MARRRRPVGRRRRPHLCDPRRPRDDRRPGRSCKRRSAASLTSRPSPLRCSPSAWAGTWPSWPPPALMVDATEPHERARLLGLTDFVGVGLGAVGSAVAAGLLGTASLLPLAVVGAALA